MKPNLKWVGIGLCILAGVFFWQRAGAAPLPPKLVVNHDLKQCAEIFAGDECMDCFAPAGWEDLGFSSDAVCPADYSWVELETECQPFKTVFCCTQGHSGAHGDCEDMIINRLARKCAFVEDVNTCNLPARWYAKPENVANRDWECPYDSFDWEEDIQCEAEASPAMEFSSAVLLGCAIGLLIFGGLALWFVLKSRKNPLP